ncbi:hypothetical protein ABBQ38_15512 [Trebouxia sp. C0009 RCD-2024]
MKKSVRPTAPSLTSELWAKVFAHLELPQKNGSWDYFDQRQQQARLHQLKLVCKQFREVFTSHPALVQQLYISSDFCVRALPSLLAWLHQSKNSVQYFQSECRSPLVDAVVSGLVSPQPSLKSVSIRDISVCSLSLLAAFTRLETCSLWNAKEERLDLTPLQGLPRLTHLSLGGQFMQLHHLVGLTHLQCVGASVLGVRKFALTLQHLEIKHSTLRDIDTRGLSTCPALTHLELNNVCLVLDTREGYLDRNLTLVPANVRWLTHLHTLHLYTGTNVCTAAVNLDWVYTLTTLQDLSITLNRHSQEGAIMDASMLTNLTCLSVLGVRDNCGIGPLLNIAIDWYRLHAPQCLAICDCRLVLDVEIAGLLQLQHLKEITLEGIVTCNEENTGLLVAFTNNLARRRPQVELSLDCAIPWKTF